MDEDTKLICLVAAIIVAGERANLTLVNPGNAYQYNPGDALRAAASLVQQARSMPR